MILRRVLVVTGLAVVAVFVGPVTPACACSCAEMSSQRTLDESEIAFVGVVTKIKEPLFANNSGAPMDVTLAVSQVYKGAVPARITVTTAMYGASCGYEFQEGGRYLVLARQWEGSITTGLCSGNRDLATETNPFESGYPPGPAPPEGRSITTVVATGTAVALALMIGVGLLLWRRRRAPHDPRDHEVRGAETR